MYKLTPKQIQTFDEITRDKKANEATLKIALTHHSNMLNDIERFEHDMWSEISHIHGISLYDKKWMLDREAGCVVVKEE